MSEIKYSKVSELAPNIRDLNVVAKVIELSEVREVTSRSSGEQHSVMDILIGDDTGVVYFSAWNEQIEKIKVDETYQFLNAKTILFKRQIRLSLGRNGSLEDTEQKIEEVNSENNLSQKEHDIPRKQYRDRGYQDRRPRYDR